MNDKSPLDKIKSTLSDAADTVRDTASDAADTAKDAAHDAKHSARDAKGTAADAVDDAKDTLSDAAHDAKKKVEKGADRASDQLADLRRTSPADDLEKSAKDARSFLAKQHDKHPVAALILVGLIGILIGRGLNRR